MFRSNGRVTRPSRPASQAVGAPPSPRVAARCALRSACFGRRSSGRCSRGSLRAARSAPRALGVNRRDGAPAGRCALCAPLRVLWASIVGTVLPRVAARCALRSACFGRRSSGRCSRGSLRAARSAPRALGVDRWAGAPAGRCALCAPLRVLWASIVGPVLPRVAARCALRSACYGYNIAQKRCRRCGGHRGPRAPQVASRCAPRSATDRR